VSPVDYHGWTHRPKAQGGTDPIGLGVFPSFRAAIHDNGLTDLSAQRRPYFGSGEVDIVFWNHWWTDYDASVFEPVIETELVSGEDCVAAVELLKFGFYGIYYTIDWEVEPPADLDNDFTTWLGSNFDDGGLKSIDSRLTSDILGTWDAAQFRVVWPFNVADEFNVQITAAHDNNAREPLYIPGGNSGFWAVPPTLTIVYFGPIDAPDNFGEGVL
jgi:hypothetical protein